MLEIEKTYLPHTVEPVITQKWLSAEIGKAKGKEKGKIWTMMMPPPNVTGVLHLGHAMTLTVEDILVRFWRLRGKDVLWLPGTDHAGIATQNVVEKKLLEQGIPREQLKREEFVEKVWEWKETYHARIVKQIQLLGASCDWTRESFTLDAPRVKAVQTAFLELYKKGLIYRSKKLVNWCPRCQTVLSDIEVKHKEEIGNLYYIRYFVSATDRSICVATTRPETLLGDVAVAVHPNDRRYRDFVGKKLILPIVNREIPILADSRIDPKFGTGAVKITPAHDPLDAEIGKDHQLESVVVIGPHGKMTKNAGKRFAGLPLTEGRQAVIQCLDNIGNLEKIDKHTHSVGHCSRCQTSIEPLESLQWFVKMQPLAEKALKLLQKRKIEFKPARFEKEFIRWLSEIRDWCISRQLLWGHRLPVWYCKKVPIRESKCKKQKEGCCQTIVASKPPKKCPYCGNLALAQDPDVLDTWFSSGLWPFATLGWPSRTGDFQNFYPNTILETGYDILFFWVTRMLMLGVELTRKPPFKTIYLHGLVRDEQGRKMSKSTGNGIDPLAMIEKYGTDALRFSLTIGSTPGVDLKFSETKIAGTRNFVNKLWNAARFVLSQTKKIEIPSAISVKASNLHDKSLLSKLNRLILEATTGLENFALAEVATKLQNFIWHDFCDWYLELTKEKPNTKLLLFVLSQVLKIAHPFLPFVTEKIWQNFTKSKNSKLLAQEKWPRANAKLITLKAEKELETIAKIIATIRSVRSELSVEPAKKITAIVHADQASTFLKKHAREIKRLARLNSLQIKKSGCKMANAIARFEGGLEIYLPLKTLVEPKIEIKRIARELKTAESYLKIIGQKLKNEDFLSRAPKNIIRTERNKEQSIKEKIVKIKARIEILSQS